MKKLLILIVAYNAEQTINDVIRRIPTNLQKLYKTEVLILDDCSKDSTLSKALAIRQDESNGFPITVLSNPRNQGYGGNQKIGYHYAVKENFDYVVLLHGDAQYAPEVMPSLVEPLALGVADAVMGSRMLHPMEAIRGGMPLYKFVGNKILTRFQNILLNANLSEYHTGYRAYSTELLRQIPFSKNTNDFHFDTEIIIQILANQLKIAEVPIPTHYGSEKCHVNGMKYAKDVVLSTIKYKLQPYGVLYDAKYDTKKKSLFGLKNKPEKASFYSSHSVILKHIKPFDNVLCISRFGDPFVRHLANRTSNFSVLTVSDSLPLSTQLDSFLTNREKANANGENKPYSWVLFLDYFDQNGQPDKLLQLLRQHYSSFISDARFGITVGNIGFVITRAMLLFGQFNYSQRGILSLSNQRMYTRRSIKQVLTQNGYIVLRLIPSPPPIPYVVRNKRIAMIIHNFATFLSKSVTTLFAFQYVAFAQMAPDLDLLLTSAQKHTNLRSDQDSHKNPIPISDTKSHHHTNSEYQTIK
ncbi:MAG: glycosyltransferase family 2 protein [Candidatus Dormibacteria bacterium]